MMLFGLTWLHVGKLAAACQDFFAEPNPKSKRKTEVELMKIICAPGAVKESNQGLGNRPTR
jgi:hypothetical protein